MNEPVIGDGNVPDVVEMKPLKRGGMGWLGVILVMFAGGGFGAWCVTREVKPVAPVTTAHALAPDAGAPQERDYSLAEGDALLADAAKSQSHAARLAGWLRRDGMISA